MSEKTKERTALEARAGFRPLTYLCCPYTSRKRTAGARLREQRARFVLVTRATAWLIENAGWNVLSPITHSHPIHVLAGLKGDWKTWERIDLEFIDCSRRAVVLCIPGWRESVGVTAELKYIRASGLPVLYVKPTPGDNQPFTLSEK